MQPAPLHTRTFVQTTAHAHAVNIVHKRNLALIKCLKQIVADLREGTIVFRSDELVPKILAVGETRGTSDFEGAVIDLLFTLAKKIPSGEYGREFVHYL